MGFLEAYKNTGFGSQAGKILVKIERLENVESSYRVTLNFVKLPKHKEDLRQSSKITNRFIDQLIRKPKDADSKSKEKQVTLS